MNVRKLAKLANDNHIRIAKGKYIIRHERSDVKDNTRHYNRLKYSIPLKKETVFDNKKIHNKKKNQRKQKNKNKRKRRNQDKSYYDDSGQEGYKLTYNNENTYHAKIRITITERNHIIKTAR